MKVIAPLFPPLLDVVEILPVKVAVNGSAMLFVIVTVPPFCAGELYEPVLPAPALADILPLT